MTDDAWFGVTPEPVARWVLSSPITTEISTESQQESSE
jgi:hypothetical protein